MVAPPTFVITHVSRLAIAIAIATTLVGCSAAAPANNSLPVTEADASAPTKPPGKKDKGTTELGQPEPATEPPTKESGQEAKAYVFAHDRRDLYRFDPTTSAFTKVGAFPCLDQGEEVIDLAINSSGAAYATAQNGVRQNSRFLKIDPLNASCTVVATSTTRLYPNALSFVAKGTVDATADALVGYQNTDKGTVYVRVDLTTGAMVDIGVLQRDLVSARYASSGDIVALDGGKAYLTVSRVDGTSTDSLVEIDPRTGEMVNVVGTTGFDKLWGLAYWESKGYAFSGAGKVVALDIATGVGTEVKVNGQPTTFYGAAVTTVAPK